MEKPNLTMAQQVAEAAAAFEKQRTGHAPQAVTVVLGDETLVITLHGALSPAERALAQTPEGAAQVQDFHRQLFNDSADWLRQEIKRITGVEVREAKAEIETTTGTVVQVFTTGTVVQVFLLASGISADTWNGSGIVKSVMSTEVLPCWSCRENDWNPLWSEGLSASSACSRSRYSNSGAAACDSASRSIRPFLSIVGRCGKRSAPAANQTVLWRIPQRRWSDIGT